MAKKSNIEPPQVEVTIPAPTAQHTRSLDPEVEKEIETIYQEEGDERDMTRLVQTKRSTLRRVLAGAVVFFALLTVVSWAGFLFFSGSQNKFSGDKVELLIEGDAGITGGSVETYVFRYKNNESIPLGTASLEIRLPKEFQLVSSEPAPVGNAWKLGSIAPGKEGIITLRGTVLAPKDKPLDFQAILTYRPADFNSEFQKVTTRTVAVSDSVIDLTVDGPAKAMPGDKITLLLKYKNESELDAVGARVTADFPAAFIPESSEPKSTNDSISEWLLPALKAGAEGSIAVSGSFASNAQGKVDLPFNVGFSDADGSFLPQEQVVFTSGVIKGDLVTTLILGGKAENQQVSFGDTLHFAVGYKNAGESTLGNVTLTLVIDALPIPGAMLRWNELKDTRGGAKNENSVTWTSKQVPALATIKPGEEGLIDIDLPILTAPIADQKEYSITSWIESTIETVDGEKVGRTAKSQPIVAKIGSDVTVVEDARYFNADGVPVGSGPLPPKVGESTTYRVFWNITNSLHELADLRLAVPLPDGVVWNGVSNVDAGSLRYDGAASKMIWTLNRLPTNITKLGINFDLAITPTPEQAGKLPTLVDALIFEATDRATGETIILSAPPLTTALENDLVAAGKGRVTE